MSLAKMASALGWRDYEGPADFVSKPLAT